MLRSPKCQLQIRQESSLRRRILTLTGYKQKHRHTKTTTKPTILNNQRTHQKRNTSYSGGVIIGTLGLKLG